MSGELKEAGVSGAQCGKGREARDEAHLWPVQGFKLVILPSCCGSFCRKMISCFSLSLLSMQKTLEWLLSKSLQTPRKEGP